MLSSSTALASVPQRDSVHAWMLAGHPLTALWRGKAHVPNRSCSLTLSRPGGAQVIRLSSQDVPTAYAFELEAATIVQPEQVIEAVHKVAGTPVAA